jgi:hypothetical protein
MDELTYQESDVLKKILYRKNKGHSTRQYSFDMSDVCIANRLVEFGLIRLIKTESIEYQADDLTYVINSPLEIVKHRLCK